MFSLRHRVAQAFWHATRPATTSAVQRGRNERLLDVIHQVQTQIDQPGAIQTETSTPLAELDTPAQSLLNEVNKAGPPPPITVPQYEDPTLSLFTSLIQRHGHRHRAAKITSRMLLHLFGMTQSEPLPLFRRAISMASPSVRMRTLKRGGRNLLTPMSLSEKQRTRAAIQWILEAAGGRMRKGIKRTRGPGGHRLEQRVAKVIIGILTDPNSPVVAKKVVLHQLAVANRSNIGMRM